MAATTRAPGCDLLDPHQGPITTWLVQDGRADYVAEDDTLTAAVESLRQYWQEETGPQWFELRDAGGHTLAVMYRRETDTPEVCRTAYLGGGELIHECRYVLDAEGQYVRTDVERVA